MKKISTLLLLALLCSGLTYAQDKSKGVKFTNSGDRIVIPPTALNLGRSAFTIEAKIIADPALATIMAPVIIGKKDKTSASTDGVVFGINEKGKLWLQMGNENFPRPFTKTNPGVTGLDYRTGSCYHVAYTRETNGVMDTVQAFQDGALIKNTRQESYDQWDITSNDTVFIGYSNFNGAPAIFQWQGVIKEIRIWNYARSESEIWSNKDKHLVGNESGLLFYYRMHENTGSTAYDCGPSGADGTLHNATWASFSGTGCGMDNIPSPNNCMPANPPPTGIEEAASHENITMYPNPVLNEIRINNTDNSKIDFVRIHDLSGRVVLQQNWNGSDALNVTSLESGMYMIQLSNDNQIVYTTTFSKQ